MGFSKPGKSIGASLSTKTSNKLKRKELYVLQKKDKDKAQRELRFRRKKEEDKNPELKVQRLAKNKPKTLDSKRVWDDVDDDSLGMQVDVEQLKRRRIEEEEAAQNALLDQEIDAEEDEGNDDDDDDADSMLASDDDDDNEEDEETAAAKRAERERKREEKRRARRDDSAAPSTTSTNLDLTPSSLALKFPALFTDTPPPAPKILITTSLNSTLHHEADIFRTVFPNATYVPRSAHRYGHKYSLREISKFAANRDYTAVVLLKEDQKKLTGMSIVHLPAGPTFTFSITNFMEGKKLPGHGNPTNHYPELLLAQTTTSASVPPPTGACSPLLVDDWASQSRLDFLGYNSLLLPTNDDGTMQSRVVNNNRITLTPKSTSAYFYSQVGCLDARNFGGVSVLIKAAAGTTFKVELTSKTTCEGATTASSVQTTAQLGWTFDGTEKLYSFPLSRFSSANLSKLRSIVLSSPNNAVTLGPLSFYCGGTPSGWTLPTTSRPGVPTGTVEAPSATASAFVVDTFGNANTNSLGFWHGGGDLALGWGANRLTVTGAPDYAFTTLLSNGCRDLRGHAGSYLHIAFSGHAKFSVSLQQHNAQCSDAVAPYPETRDSVEAARYARGNDLYTPISHFNINLQRVSSVAIRGIYTSEPLVLTKIEVVPSIPSGVAIPQKLPSGTLVFACTRPNSFAFGIDDGNPRYAARLAQIIKDAGIKVTFFAVGAVLENDATGMRELYKQLRGEGHQIALHSYTHPRMEGLPTVESIDWEYNEDFRVMTGIFGERSSYFRPPYGVEGARMRQRWAAISGAARNYIVNWSVDVQDWLWAETSTPEKQVDAFKADVAKGGNLVVMHFSYNSTVEYFPEFIRQAKATGKQIMRIDQCLEDPNAPPL